MLLCWKAIDLASGCAAICEKCHDKLSRNNLRALSLTNLMWLGDVPPELQCLTLSEQKLIALVRIILQCIRIVQKFCVVFDSIDIRVVSSSCSL